MLEQIEDKGYKLFVLYLQNILILLEGMNEWVIFFRNF